ncbi:MAG: biotin/lipoyl-binding protein [Paraprevotella sp.]|nr:biotin/lipoyl-binding protein [Paraprevotella sp.]MBQ8282355.1 biotin/lipoyl-binding protein [Paraprevotella sp.]MBQ8283450.1 biotin/lipoyl-binding protein [Paraprevotella sp.]MBR2380128.1 biotin/lipoyl-binding protein [Paraprevotella sp.]
MKEYKYKVKGAEYVVKINEVEGNKAQVEVNGIPFEVEMDRPMNLTHKPVIRPVAHVHQAPTTPAAQPQPKVEVPAGNGVAVCAPLPGTVNAVAVTVGQAVKKGQPVVVLEAMKMENNINAECDGTVTAVHVSKGDSVREGAILVTIG